ICLNRWGYIDSDNKNFWFHPGQCLTPNCEGEMCNSGCEVGWVSGSVGTCCRDMLKPCHGPVSADVTDTETFGFEASETNPNNDCVLCDIRDEIESRDFWKNVRLGEDNCNRKGHKW